MTSRQALFTFKTHLVNIYCCWLSFVMIYNKTYVNILFLVLTRSDDIHLSFL